MPILADWKTSKDKIPSVIKVLLLYQSFDSCKTCIFPKRKKNILKVNSPHYQWYVVNTWYQGFYSQPGNGKHEN